MQLIFKNSNCRSMEQTAFIEDFFQSKTSSLYWGNSLNEEEYVVAKEKVKELATTGKTEISNILINDFIISELLQNTMAVSTEEMFSLTFDQDTWRVFNKWIPIIPIVLDLSYNEEYDDIIEVMEKSPLVCFARREDYVEYRDRFENIGLLMKGTSLLKDQLEGSILRLSEETNSEKLFKGLVLSEQLKEVGIDNCGILCDGKNSQMLELALEYFPNLELIEYDQRESGKHLSIYLYNVEENLMNQIDNGFFFQNYQNSVKIEELHKIEITNRNIKEIIQLSEDAFSRHDDYRFIANKEILLSEFDFARIRFSDEDLVENRFVDAERIGESSILLHGHLEFDKPIADKGFNLQLVLIKRNQETQYSIFTEVKVRDKGADYQAKVDFESLDLLKGNFDVYIFYNSWNLRIYEPVIFQEELTILEKLKLNVFSREISSEINDEGILSFRVSEYLIE